MLDTNFGVYWIILTCWPRMLECIEEFGHSRQEFWNVLGNFHTWDKIFGMYWEIFTFGARILECTGKF